MSTVPPAAALPLLVVLPLLLLLLLLQPTAAKAIAVKAAIAVVRLMIFLSSIVRSPRSVLTDPVWAHGATAAGDGRSDEVPYGGRAALGVGSGQDSGPGERRRKHLGRRFSLPNGRADQSAADLLNSG
jgi:hypothetical protein